MSQAMEQPQKDFDGAQGNRMVAQRAAIRAGVAAAVLFCGVLAVHGLETAMQATFDKPPAPLTKELPSMQRELGLPVRYISTKPDEVLSPEIVDTLGTDKYLVREYVDKTVSAGAPGTILNLNVNYYATGSSTPHVPETCWKGNGRVETSNSRINFDVKGIKRPDGSTIDVRMRMVSFQPLPGQASTNAKGEAIYSNVAYVFQVNGQYVAGPEEVTSHFWKASYKYAYHSKIEITPLESVTAPDGTKAEIVLNCTQDEAKRIISDFVREALPAVEECLPDPSILSQSEPVK